MPYIGKNRQELINRSISDLACRILEPGEMNFLISSIIWNRFKRDQTYSTANILLGVLEAVKQEFYRRYVAPYEDKKMKENGDL
jgi:hypothetical protein